MTKATELLQIQDQIFKSFPEVDHVLGKAGRADTATDPAPTEMFETTITLKPEEQWRPGMTYEKLVAEMDRALQIPGIANAWTMPIKGRIEMLSTGLRTTLGIKVFGNDLAELERIAQKLADIVRAVPGTTSAYAERIMGGHALDIVPDRRQLARYGLSVADVTGIIASGVGAETVTTMIEGRERYPVSLRLPRRVTTHRDRYDDSALPHAIDDYDRRRDAVHAGVDCRDRRGGDDRHPASPAHLDQPFVPHLGIGPQHRLQVHVE